MPDACCVAIRFVPVGTIPFRANCREPRVDKRTLLAVVLCMGIALVWWKIFPPVPPPPQSVAPTAAATTALQDGAARAQVGSTTPDQTAPAKSEGQVVPSAQRGPEQLTVLDTPSARFILSNHGGVLNEVRLRESKYLSRKGDPDSGMAAVAAAPGAAPLHLSFPKADFTLADDVAWTVTRPNENAVTFRAENAQVAVEKRYTALPGKYRLGLVVDVENKSDKPAAHNVALHLYRQQDPAKKGGSFLSYAEANITEMVCFVDGKPQRNEIEKLKDGEENVGAVRWIAADEKFVTLAAVPEAESPPLERKCGRKAVDATTGEVFLSFTSRTLAPAAHTAYGFTVFAGPKDLDEIDQVRPGGEDAHLGEVVNVTFAVLSRPLLYLLKLFHHWAGNWGLAIIMLTLFVKLVTFYPTWRTMASAKKMQRLAPEVAKLRKKYENDKQRLGTETMNMYKAHGVSPFGGCLPSLIQMPIWIALFSTLNYSVELYRSEFFGYIHDLSARDPFYITPLLMGAVMVVQMRMSPAGTDPQQQKMMAIMMPIMFTGFSLFLPAALAVYTLTSYLIGIAQQLLINYADKRTNGIAAARPSPA